VNRLYIFFFILFPITNLLAQNQLVTKVPFTLINNHIIIKLQVNDSEPVNFLFDSGAGGTLISKSFAERMDFNPTIERVNIGAAGTHKVGIIRGVDLKTGAANINGVNIMLDGHDMEELDNGEEVSGIIGFHILSRFVVKLDYDQSVMLLFNKSGFDYTGNGYTYDFNLKYNIPAIRANISLTNGDTFEGIFLVDTGAKSELLISSPTVIAYNLVDNVGDNYVLRTKLGSSQKRVKIMYGRIASFDIAGQHFTQVPVVLSSTNEGVLSFDNINGIIGNKILQRFNITFDYANDKLYFEPNGNLNRKFKTNAAGLSVFFNSGQPYIKDVVDRSPASKGGLKNGDQIISINGELVENIDKKEIRSIFFQSGTQLDIVIMRNGKLKYTEVNLQELI
jgi:predicted aspartyl protease